MILIDLVRLARPRDWIKNVFMAIPIPFAVTAGAHFDPLPFLLGLVGFCLVNSAVYTFNDLLDAEADRLHTKKRNRPIAAGRVPPSAAIVQAVLLVVFATALFSLITPTPTGVLFLAVTYIAANIVYSAGAKHVVLVDVFILCSGFVIRVFLGCVLVGVNPSAWLLLCTSALALFLGFTKRKADIVAGVQTTNRPILTGYSREFLDQAITICATVSMLAYAIYSVNSSTFIQGRELASMPFMVYGVLYYLRLSHDENIDGSPVTIAYSSWQLQLTAVLWIVAIIWSLGIVHY